MTDQDALAVTRRGLHAVAELVLAGPQHRATGRLRLRVVPGGFATTQPPGFRTDGTEVTGTGTDGGPAGGAAAAINGRSPRAIGAQLGIAAGRPEGAYADGCGVGLDDPLTIDPAQAEIIVRALVTGHDALTAFAPGQAPVLWPGHFDVAIRVADVNYGVSPGDGFSAEPYAYVGVASPPDGDAFWNAPFGAARPLREFADTAAVTAFYAAGRSRQG